MDRFISILRTIALHISLSTLAILWISRSPIIRHFPLAHPLQSRHRSSEPNRQRGYHGHRNQLVSSQHSHGSVGLHRHRDHLAGIGQDVAKKGLALAKPVPVPVQTIHLVYLVSLVELDITKQAKHTRQLGMAMRIQASQFPSYSSERSMDRNR